MERSVMTAVAVVALVLGAVDGVVTARVGQGAATGGALAELGEGRGLSLTDFKAKQIVAYNIGHLVTAEGDTVSPDGRYMVALNKWSIDRYPLVGTLKPQSFQLIDLESDRLRILSEVPILNAEPHYVEMIRADKLIHR